MIKLLTTMFSNLQFVFNLIYTTSLTALPYKADHKDIVAPGHIAIITELHLRNEDSKFTKTKTS